MAEVTRKVGRFEILREVGRGGMAVVYLARQTDLDRSVALKELPAFHASDSDFAERFLRESRIAGSLSHPNIVTVHDYFDVEGTPYISMEYLERGSLRPHVRNMSLPQVAGVLEGLLAALDHAHARGIVHRDLKPENLLLTRQGSVKVADFGIAKAINQASQLGQINMLTATGTTVGTPTYMAPEQAMARDIGPATDLYSVGVMAYEMLVGQVPFANAETPLAVLLRHVNEPPPPPLSIKPDLDPRLATWVESLLEKDPRARPPSAEAAWDTFEEIVLSLSGPRWRRQARLLDPGEPDAPKPLTPAPFPLPVEAPGSEFLTYGGSSAPAAAPAPAVATPPAAATPAPPPVAPPAPSEPEPAPAGGAFPVPAPPSEDGYQTFDVAPVPKAPAAAAPAAPPAPPAGGALPVPAPVDGYKTFDAAPVETPPPPPPPPPPPKPEPEPAPKAEPKPAPKPKTEPKQASAPAPETAPEPEPADGLAGNLTLPPSGVPLGQSFEWPAAKPAPVAAKRKVPLIAWLGLLVVGGGGLAAAAAFLTSGGSSEQAQTTAASTPATTARTTKTVTPIADVTVPTIDQVGLTGSGGALYLVTPRGYIARLNPKTLGMQKVATDGVRPRALAVTGGRLVVASAGGVSALARGTLAPVPGFAALTGAKLLAGGDGAPVVAVGSARVCLVDPAVVACGALAKGFVATGAGIVRADSSVVLANASAGTIVQMRRKGARLVASKPIPAGPGAHGTLLSFSGLLYVPIRRGLAVVDLSGKTKTTQIALPTSPAEVWISPAGRLFATLPASNGVAVVNLAGAGRAVHIVPVGGRPQGIAGVGGTVYVAGTTSRTVSRLSAASGSAIGQPRPIPVLRGPLVAPTVATSVAHKAGAAAVVFTVALRGPPLARRDVLATATAIRSGQARFTIWRDGVRSSARPASAGGATLALGAGSGRLTLALSAKADAFTAVAVTLAGGGHKLVVTLQPAPVKTPPQTTTHQQTTTPPQTTTTPTQTTTTPPKTTTTPPKTTTTPPKTTTGPEIG